MLATTIQSLTIFLQIAAALFCLRLVKSSDVNRLAWSAIGLALGLAALYTTIVIINLTIEGSTPPFDLASAVITFLVSLLLLFGIVRVATVFQTLKQSEADLRGSRSELANVERVAHIGNWEWDLASGVLTYSDETAKIFNLSAHQQLTSQEIIEMIHPEDIDAFRDDYADALADKKPLDVVHRLLLDDGLTRLVHTHGELSFDDEGSAVRVKGTIQDITERRKAEQQIAEFSRIFEDSLNEICLFDAETLRFSQVNKAAQVNLGYSLEELKNLTPVDISPEEDFESFNQLVEPLRTGEQEKIVFEAIHRRKDQSLYEVELHLQLLQHENESKFACISLDISDRKKAEADKTELETQVRHAQRFESIGTMAGGIAHDFNNVLTPIMGFTELAMSETEASTNQYKNLEQVLVAAGRAKSLIEQIMIFSRRGERAPKTLAVMPLLKETLKLLRPSLPTTINILQQFNASNDKVFADETQIHQVILNLCTNAWQAMEPGGGDLSIELENVELDAELQQRMPQLNISSPYLCLTVRDTGPGIEEEIMDHIFDPFFTTKTMNEGTGLGLSVVQGIVKSHAGDILVQSEPGVGSVFSVYLPIYVEDSDAPAPIGLTTAGGDESIMIIDDEVAITSLLDQILKNLGYKTSVFNDSQEALQAFKNNPQNYDLIITDLNMPNLSGSNLSEQVYENRPLLPVILITGYSDEVLSGNLHSQFGIKKLLLKPLKRLDLVSAVREVLDA